MKPGQGIGDLARLAGFKRPKAAPALENGQKVVLSPAGIRLEPLPEGQRRLAGLRLNLNRASAQDLTLLSGLGPARAAAIVRTRRRLGRFKDIKQLNLVPGLPAGLIKSLATELEI